MAPSQIQIATSVLQRLLKEELSYFKEQEQQEARIAKLEKDGYGPDETDGNDEFRLKQEVSPLLFFSTFFFHLEGGYSNEIFIVDRVPSAGSLERLEMIVSHHCMDDGVIRNVE